MGRIHASARTGLYFALITPPAWKPQTGAHGNFKSSLFHFGELGATRPNVVPSAQILFAATSEPKHLQRSQSPDCQCRRPLRGLPSCAGSGRLSAPSAKGSARTLQSSGSGRSARECAGSRSAPSPVSPSTCRSPCRGACATLPLARHFCLHSGEILHTRTQNTFG